jgi:cytochrome P450 monooxygenase
MDPEISWTTIPAGRSGWRVTGHERIRELLEDRRLDLNPDPRLATQWYQDSPLHRVLIRMAARPIPEGGSDFGERALRRGTMTRMFSVQQLQAIMPTLQAIAAELIDAMAATGPPADLTAQFSMPFCLRAVGELLHLPPSDVDKLRDWAGDHEERDMRASLLGLRRFMTYVNKLIEQRREQPGDDILSLLVATEEFDEAHAGMIPNIVAFLLGLGWQVPASAIDHGVLLFTAHPDQLRLFLADPGIRPGAVEEVLRLFSSASAQIGGVDRYANTDFEIDGVKVQAGEMVLLDIPAGNRDGRVFDRPEQFDIRRTPNPHLTFGHGFYYCNFNKIARAQMDIGLSIVFERFPALRLAEDREKLVYRDRPESGVVSLPVTW